MGFGLQSDRQLHGASSAPTLLPDRVPEGKNSFALSSRGEVPTSTRLHIADRYEIDVPRYRGVTRDAHVPCYRACTAGGHWQQARLYDS